MGETGGKWGLGGVLSKVLEKKRAQMGVGGCTESGGSRKMGANGGWGVY